MTRTRSAAKRRRRRPAAAGHPAATRRRRTTVPRATNARSTDNQPPVTTEIFAELRRLAKRWQKILPRLRQHRSP